MDEFAKAYVGNGKQIILCWDGAPAHRATSLRVPDGVTCVSLPPYPPELNPAEQLWPLVKEGVANESFKELGALEKRVCRRVRAISKDRKLISSRLSDHWWPNAYFISLWFAFRYKLVLTRRTASLFGLEPGFRRHGNILCVGIKVRLTPLALERWFAYQRKQGVSIEDVNCLPRWLSKPGFTMRIPWEFDSQEDAEVLEICEGPGDGLRLYNEAHRTEMALTGFGKHADIIAIDSTTGSEFFLRFKALPSYDLQRSLHSPLHESQSQISEGPQTQTKLFMELDNQNLRDQRTEC